MAELAEQVLDDGTLLKAYTNARDAAIKQMVELSTPLGLRPDAPLEPVASWSDYAPMAGDYEDDEGTEPGDAGMGTESQSDGTASDGTD